jgi:outer membrane protein OmpA-like peptidoglycan-associated protein
MRQEEAGPRGTTTAASRGHTRAATTSDAAAFAGAAVTAFGQRAGSVQPEDAGTAERAEKPLSDVFFALDSSDLTDEGRSALQKDSEWMRKWTTTKVTVEGTATAAGRPSTTSRSVTGGRRP